MCSITIVIILFWHASMVTYGRGIQNNSSTSKDNHFIREVCLLMFDCINQDHTCPSSIGDLIASINNYTHQPTSQSVSHYRSSLTQSNNTTDTQSTYSLIHYSRVLFVLAFGSATKSGHIVVLC